MKVGSSSRSVIFSSLFMTLFALGGCDAIQEMIDPANALVERKLEQQQMIDSLYNQYGGLLGPETETATAPKSNGQEGGFMDFANALVDSVKTAVKEGDRTTFIAYCEQLGNGERVVPLTPKAREFFAKESTATTCRNFNTLNRKIAELEAKVNQ